jgi:hypothetical protein
VPRHVTRLVTRLVAPLVIDYFDYAACSGVSTRRAACHAARRAARRRLLRVARLVAPLVVDYSASRRLVVDYFAYTARLVTWLVVPLVVDFSASRRLVVDYFDYAARLGASARRAAHRLLSTTSPTLHNRLPRLITRLVAWLVAPLVVDYFAYVVRPGSLARRAARHTAHRRLLRAPRLRLAATLPLL